MPTETKEQTELKLIAVAKPYADLRTPFTVDEKGAFAEYIVQDPEAIPGLALGATVLITDRRNGSSFWVAGHVVGLRAISPFSPERENLLYIEEESSDPASVLDHVTGPHTHQPMVIRVSLDREMEPVNPTSRHYVSNPIQRPPSALSRMTFPNILPVANDPSPSLREILDIRASGIELGNVGFGNAPYEKDGAFLTYRWDVDNLDNKHIFIVGESGSGKTVLLKNLAYQFRKHDKTSRLIMTDVQGDIVQLLLPDIAAILKPQGWQRRMTVETPEQASSALAPFRLILPARPGAKSRNLVALTALAKKRGVSVHEVGLRMQDVGAPSNVEYLFRTSSEQVAMLMDEEAEHLEAQKPPQPVTLANLRAAITRLMGSNDQQIRSDAGTPYYRTTYGAALRAIKSLGSYFDYHQPSLTGGSNPLNLFDFDGTTILYLDELDQDERIMWEMQLVRWLYENKKENWNAFVFFDEAHQIIPAKPTGIGAVGTFERLRVNFERLAREGRKFGINLVLSTQDPKDLHPIVPEQCPTRIVMKINPRNAGHVFLEPELAVIANRFGHGQFWIQSPFNGTSEWVRVHSWAPPLPHEPMTGFWNKVIETAKKEHTAK